MLTISPLFFFLGPSAESAVTALETWDWLDRLFSEELDFEISLTRKNKQGKTTAMVTNQWLWKTLDSPLRGRGVRLVARAKNLGIEHRGCGKKKGTSTPVGRMASSLRRKRRLHRGEP